MKKYFLYIPALALLAVACNKIDNNEPAPIEEEPAPVVKMITETVSGNRGVETKATISDTDASFKWSIGDNVAVHVSKEDNHKYVVTSKGADAAAASAKFEVTYEDGYSRDAFAVYPSTIVDQDAAYYGQSGQSLAVTLPSSYTLDQVSGETSPCPMIATNNAQDAGWEFYQLCGLLRLTVNSIPPSTKRLEIDFNGNKVWGNFSIADPTPGTSSIATSDDAAHDVITITNSGETLYSGWGDEKVFNIPLPVGIYTNITVTAYNASSGGDVVLTMTRPFAYTASSAHGTKRTYTFPVFSIGSSTRVFFSPGNLVKTNTETVASGNASYEFESVPFSTNGGSLGYGQGAPSATSARGYFTWDEATSLGSLTIGGISGWRVLTKDEWNYVMAGSGVGRTMKYGIGLSYVVQSTNNKCGLLLPPDCATTSDVAGMTPATAAAYQTINTGVDVDAFIAKGFVFLPAEGYYDKWGWARTATEGHYWSTSQSGDNGYQWVTDAASAPNYVTNSMQNYSKSYYGSIRLVRVIN